MVVEGEPGIFPYPITRMLRWFRRRRTPAVTAPVDPTPVAVLRAMVAMFASGDPSPAAEYVRPDYIDHEGTIRGIDGFAGVVRAYAAGYEPGTMVVTIDDVFGADDRATARIRWRGRRPDGSEVDRQTIDVVRVLDGRAAEHWGAAV
jgi:predicted SnoaL-like aldol condensation-catalyzing enzyme